MSENSDTETTEAPQTDSERFGRTRTVLRGTFGLLIALVGLGALASLGTDPLGALVAGVLYIGVAALLFRRTRGRVLDLVDRDVGVAGLGVALIVMLSVAGAAAPTTPSSADAPDGASAAADTPTATPMPAAASDSDATATAMQTDAQTPPPTATATSTPTPTATPTATPTPTPIPTATATPMPTATATPTATPTASGGFSSWGAADGDLKMRVIAGGQWSGSIATESGSRTVDGYGTETFDIPDDAQIVTLTAMKYESGNDPLIVQLRNGNEVVAESETTASFGTAQVSESFY